MTNRLTIHSIVSYRPRKEAFLPHDSTYIKSAPSVVLGKFIDSGTNTEVYFVKNNRNMIVKVPTGYVLRRKGVTESQRMRLIRDGVDVLQNEFDFYTDNDLEHEKLIIPTILVNLPENDLGATGVIGLMRPRLNTFEYGKELNDAQFKLLKSQLISISYKGLYLVDGVQLGVDRAGRILLFDLGGIKKGSMSTAFNNNNKQWLDLLDYMAQLKSKRKYSDYIQAIRELKSKYGYIVQD
jgi:hypothetical protein